MTAKTPRRRLLAAAALLGGSTTLAALLRGRGRKGLPHLSGEIDGRFRFPAGAQAVGRLCLKVAPTLLDEPSVRAFGDQPADWGGLSRRMGEDLDAGRTIAVRGWTLSLTEARIYALMALLARR